MICVIGDDLLSQIFDTSKLDIEIWRSICRNSVSKINLSFEFSGIRNRLIETGIFRYQNNYTLKK